MKNNKKIKLLVFDMDGTALGGHKPYEMFPKAFAKYLDELSERSIRWATNTTWAPRETLNLARRSGVKSDPAFLTGQTSRLLATVKRGKFAYDEDHAKMILRQDKRFKKQNWPRVRKIFMKILSENLADRICYDFFHHNTIAFSCTKGNSRKVWELMAPLIDDGKFYSFSARRSGANGMLLPGHMNKGEIMKTLLKRMGIGPENVIVAGDASNDLHMFDPKYAQWMVCPANSQPVLKARVKEHGGVIARKKYSWGVIEGVKKILST